MLFPPSIIYRSVLAAVLTVVPLLAPAAPQISEFMARNDETIADEDGDFSDWLEIHNPDGTPFDLSGCYLTDDPGELTQWQFPTGTEIDADGFLVVFASDKNRAVAGSEFHTSFKLGSAAGNYLALVAADGGTILDEYTYPAQEDDISFGISQQSVAVSLIETADPVILVPQAANELPADWFTNSYVPGTAWISGTASTAVGYDTSQAPVPLVNVALNGTASQSTSHNAGPANRGVDGNTGNFSHTAISDNDAWWQVIFPADEEIHQLVLHNRDSCCHERFRDLTIEIRNAGGSVLYTSPLLNPENALNDPELIEWDVAADNGAPVTGRTVRIRRTADPDASGQGAVGGNADANVLSLGEVLVMVPDPNATGGEGERNLAPDGAASQTSTLNAFEAARGIDEDPGNFTHTVASDTSPEWTLQLAHRSILSEITIHNRDNCCGFRLRDITVEILDSNGATTFLSELLNPEDIDGAPELINLDLVGITGDPVIGQTVTIRRTPDPDFSGQGGSGSQSDANVLSLGEVEVVGEPVFGFTSFINDDIEVEALNNNASAFVRIPFPVDDPLVLESLQLRVRYDDGFVGYLNGAPIVSRNAPASPTWNSTALSERDSAAAFQFEEIDISSALGSLNVGTNVMAIQMLNSSATDADFFLQPQLLATTISVNEEVFLSTPTPGASNDSEWYVDRVEATQFTTERGFYDNPFFVTLSSPTAGAQIRYTTDGNAPTATSGTPYTEPIEITATTVLRAIAYRDSYRSTDVETHTYLFRDDVIASSVMRTSVTEDPVYGPQMRDALADLPTISLAFSGDIDRDEKASSVELIGFADGDLQVDAGMSRFGSYVTNFAKRNIRLAFREIYGPKKLNYPLFAGHGRDLRPVEVFDQLDLRTGSHDMVQRGFYMSNRFLDDTFLDLGYLNPHGRFVHVYINGTYWGMYHLRERWNADMHANYLGGQKEDYEAVASNRGGGAFSDATPYDGDGSAWANVVALGNDYESLQSYLNMPQFVDFMLMLNSGRSEAEHRAVSPVGAGSGFVFYFNDGDGFTRVPPDRTGHAGPDDLWSTLRAENHPDFRVLMADRIQKLFFNDGLMAPGPAVERLLERTMQIERAFLAEAARWDYRSPASWADARDDYISDILSDLPDTLIPRFQAAGLLPATAAPEFSQHGGEVAANYSLGMSAATSGTIYFTTDGSDPRLPGGAIAASASTFTSNLILTDNAFVRARTRNGSEWSGLTEAFFTIAGIDPITADDIIISELNYHPGAVSGNTEFLEILNVGNRPVNLRGARMSNGVRYDFPVMRDIIVSPGKRIVLVSSLYQMNLAYGLGLPVVGIYEGKLNNDGDFVRLEESDGTLITELTYNDVVPWPQTADGQGASLQLIAEDASSDGNNPFHWRNSSIPGGTPGTADNGSGESDAPILINEVLTHTDLPQVDAIELHNPGPVPIDVGGWFLTDDANDAKKYRIPAATMIPAGGYLVFDESDFAVGPEAFRLSEYGEQAYLFSADASGDLTGYFHGRDFAAAPNGVSMGRHVDSQGKVHFVLQKSNSLGTGNSLPRVGPVVISEIHYHPPALAGGADNVADEFIELTNTSRYTVPLYCTDTSVPGYGDAALNDTWRLRNGVDFDFPPGVELKSEASLLVVGFDPVVDTDQLAAFRSKFDVADGVEIFGPWTGELDNTGEKIELMYPGSADPLESFFVPYYLAEEVDYEDSSPWPPLADGIGFSLQRFHYYDFGGDPLHWKAAPPQLRITGVDSDEDGMEDSWETEHGLVVGIDDSGLDPDGDTRTNLEEFKARTLPNDPSSFLSLSVTPTETGLRIRFTAAADVPYKIVYTDSLKAPAHWTEWLHFSSEPVERELQLEIEATEVQRFFQVIVSPFN